MRIFSFMHPETGEVQYFATKKEVMEEAQGVADYYHREVIVDVDTVRNDLTEKRLALVLLSGTGWSMGSKVIETVTPKQMMD